MKRIALLISLVLLFSACKITRHAVVETHTVAVEQKDISEKTTETKSDNSVVVIDEKENVRITNFSLPDSTGKQYVVSITEIQKEKTSSNKKNSVETKETLKKDKSSKQQAESTKITETSKTETKTPGWLYILVFILSSGIIVFIYLILTAVKSKRQAADRLFLPIAI